MKFLKRFLVKILVESVVGSLVSEALVAADEPKEDVWKGVLRLQTREDCIDDESGQKFDFPRCQLGSFLPSFGSPGRGRPRRRIWNAFPSLSHLLSVANDMAEQSLLTSDFFYIRFWGRHDSLIFAIC